MKTRVSKVSAAALLAVVLSLNIAPSAYAARRDDASNPGGVRDRIVQFIRDIRNFLSGTYADQIGPPRP